MFTEIGGDYTTESGESLYVYTFSGGVRFQSGTRAERFKPFAQILMGTGWDNGSVGQSTPTNHFPVVTPGGGLDIRVAAAPGRADEAGLSALRHVRRRAQGVPARHRRLDTGRDAIARGSYRAHAWSSFPIPTMVRWFRGNSSMTWRMLRKYSAAIPLS